MLTHFANPWILARLILGVTSALLASVAAVAALGIFARYRFDGPADERILTLERRAELVATTLSLAFTIEIVAALLTILASDRLAGSIRGAMCAYGVFGSNPWGANALRASLLASAGCAAWLAARRVDARIRRGSLVRTLAGLSLLVTVLVYADFVASSTFFLGLDLDVVATCCSVFVDRSGAGFGGIADAQIRNIALGAAIVLSLAGAAAGVLLYRRASVARGAIVGVLGLAGGYATLRAVTDVIAPYTYEVPNHRCPYCLLHLDAAPAGPMLLAALAAGVLLAVAALAVVPLVSREGARAAALEVLAGVGRASAAAWCVVLVAGAWPIVRYGLTTGTLQLFR